MFCGIAILFILCVATGEEKPPITEEQLQCNHEWTEIDWHAEIASDGSGVTYDIYCPKCQLEEKVSYKEWNRIQADMNYEKGE